MKRLALLLFGFALPLMAQVGPVAITSAQCATVGVGPKVSVITFQVTGTWTGTLQPQIAIQGQAAANVQVTPSTSSTAASTVTANGIYTAQVNGADTFQICGNTVASGTANVYLNYSVASKGGGGSGGGGAFSTLTAGTNSTAAMVVGSGASLATSGTGTIAATSIAGGPTYSTVSTPAAPTLATNGSAGATTITYKIVGCQDTACTYHTAASAAASIATANATLSATNSVNLSLYGVYGVQCYNVYRTAAGGTPSTTGLVGTCVSQTYKDVGGAGDSSTAPSTNTTILMTNSATLPGTTIPLGGITGIDAPQASPTATDEECNGTAITPNATITTTAGWYWVNQSTSAFAIGNGFCNVSIASSADQLYAIVQPLPAGTWTYVGKVSLETLTNFASAGLVLYESATTKAVLLPALYNGGCCQIQVYPFTNPTTRGGSLATFSGGATNQVYFRIVNDGTNLKYSISANGQNFFQLLSRTITSDFTTAPNFIGFGVNGQSSPANLSGTMDWLRRTQ